MINFIQTSHHFTKQDIIIIMDPSKSIFSKQKITIIMDPSNRFFFNRIETSLYQERHHNNYGSTESILSKQEIMIMDPFNQFYPTKTSLY